MDCDICLNPYDHSKHKPFSLTCPHTVCLDCLNKLNTKFCPSCKDPIKAKYPNLALIKLIPESKYDKLRSQLEKTIVETNDLKQKQYKEFELKLEQNLDNIKTIKEEINQKTSQLINLILKHQKNLLDETNVCETSLQLSLRKLRVDNQMEMKINDAKLSLERNALNEAELDELNSEIEKIKSFISKTITEMDKLNENYQFILKKNMDTETCVFGELKTNEKSFEECLQLAEELTNQEFYKGALYFYDKAIQIAPNHAESHSLKGNILFKMKDYKQALECYDKAIEIKPLESIFYCNKANCLTNMDEFTQSIEFFNKAIELDPNYYLAYRQKGIALQNLKKYTDSISCFDKAIEINPNFPSVYNLKGLVLYCMKEYKQAIDCYSRAIDLDPKDFVFYFNKAESLRYLKEYSHAIECLNKTIELNPNYAMAYSTKGQTLMEMKQFQLAAEAFDLACQLDAENIMYLNLKSTALRQQKTNRSSKAYQHSLVENFEPKSKRKRCI